MTKGSPIAGRRLTLGWEPFLSRCTPGKWRLNVRQVSGVPRGEVAVRATVDLPHDRDVANALAQHGCPPGRYAIIPEFKGRKGESWEVERRLVLAAKGVRIPSTTIEVSANLAAAPRAEQKARGSVQHAREEADLLQEQVRAAQERNELARLEREHQQLRGGGGAPDWAQLVDKLAEKLAPKPAEPATGSMDMVLEVVKLQGKMMEQALQAIAQQTKASIEALATRLQPQEAATPAEPLDGLGSFAKNLELVERVQELVADKAQPRSEWREIIDLVQGLVAMKQGSALPPGNGQGGAAVPAVRAAAAGQPPPPAALQKQRCAAFVGAVVTELQADSDPVAAADALYEGLGALPGSVRAHLEAGNWQAAWAALQQFTSADEWHGLDQLLRSSPESIAWLQRFAEGLAAGDDDEGGEAHAA